MTFLMTDIEGSTRLWEKHRSDMAAALEAHDGILQAAVTAHGGSVIKTTGDGLLAAFGQPDAAIACAAAAQRSLTEASWAATGPLHVRMAVHTGTAQSREGDYYGPALNRVARLLAIGHGDQVLISGTAVTLAVDALAPGLELLDLGQHRLRDLDRSEHVFQLIAPDLRRDFPALRSLVPDRTNLPSQLTSFVGRDRELAQLRDVVSDHRLVTLIGTGGTGKTRLMLHVGADLTDQYADGVWLVELAAIAGPALVVTAISRALQVGEEPTRAPIDTLTDFLRTKALLLLVDNCEHVIGPVADLVDHVLATCPTLAIIASSREALGVGGEVVFQVPSLALPATSARPDTHLEDEAGRWLDDAMASEAVRLFVDRATAASPSFSLNPASAPAVVEICARLDGIPLAIELAAARVTVLSVEEIAERLGDRFRLLTGGRRTALPRQQTLQALVDWSWDLLPELDQILLARLSVFAGWTLNAATAVTTATANGSLAPSADATTGTLDGLARLVDRSLVIVEHGEATRYRMLETIRQYARDRLIAAGDAAALREAHLAFFLDFALRAEKALTGPEMVSWLVQLDAEIDNLRSAIEWALEAHPDDALRLGIALNPYWRARSFGAEATELLRRAAAVALELPIDDGPAGRERMTLVARLLAAACMSTVVGGDAAAGQAWADQAVALARRVDDPQALSEALAALTMVRAFSGQLDRIFELGDESSRLAAARQDWFNVAMNESGAAFGHAAMGDPAAAEARLHYAIEAAERSGNPFAIAFTSLSRGRLSGMAHDLDDARPAFSRAIEGYQQLGDRRLKLAARSDLAHALRRAGAIDEAAATYRETIHAWQHLGSRGAIANQVEGIAFIALARGDAERAARLLGAAERIREMGPNPLLPNEQTEVDEAASTARQQLPTAAFEAAWDEGRRLTTDDAVALARSTTGEE